MTSNHIHSTRVHHAFTHQSHFDGTAAEPVSQAEKSEPVRSGPPCFLCFRRSYLTWPTFAGCIASRMTHRHTKPVFAGHQAFVEERKASTPVSAASNRKRALVGVRVEGKRFMARIRMPRPRVVPHSARRRQGKHLNLVRQGKQVNLGGYASEREASFAYDVAALRYGRPLNYPSRGESGLARVRKNPCFTTRPHHHNHAPPGPCAGPSHTQTEP